MTSEEAQEVRRIAAKLRHAYENLVTGRVSERNHKQFADGLISPAIQRLEKLTRGSKMTNSKWDTRFLDLAALVASWSKDPSTKAGAVIVRQDRTIASVGYNGFPRGCDDDPALYADRPTKYARVVHCEMNAIISAREPLRGFTLYTYPFLTCDRCAVHVIQSGIRTVIAPVCPPETRERWAESFERAHKCYAEAGVTVHEYPS